MSFDGNLKTFPSLRERHDALAAAGEIEPDPAQIDLIAHFDRLIVEICSKRLSRKSSALGWLFGKRSQAVDSVRGLYVHGEVGRGKTMLMDMFFHLLPVERKRRAHFNDFMADVHERIYAHRQAHKRGETKQDDPIPPVADALSQQAWVLCFDEFTVTDIADAMILSRLFSALFDRGDACLDLLGAKRFVELNAECNHGLIRRKLRGQGTIGVSHTWLFLGNPAYGRDKGRRRALANQQAFAFDREQQRRDCKHQPDQD